MPLAALAITIAEVVPVLVAVVVTATQQVVWVQ